MWVLKEKKERERVYCVVEVVFKKILIYLRKNRLFVKMAQDTTMDPHQHISEEILRIM